MAIPDIKSNDGCASRGLRVTYTRVAPVPYKGSSGPVRKPLLINFLSLIETKVLSYIHPKKLKI